MQVLVTTDQHVQGGNGLSRHVESVIRSEFERFGSRVTRVQVHLADENGSAKETEADKRCTIEIRLAGLQPIAATHHADTVDQALDGAADKLKTTLDRTLGRLNEQKGNTSYAGEPFPS